ncbi:hypothetical protein [Nostoc sp.]|uniref:hypothetical protein n=1 Tax=Nostoc sp. TaxID=1180 RepID=UPI0035932D15
MPTAASYAPLGVASPQFVQGVSENEVDLPVAMDCTTLTLVDAVPSQSTSLLAETQDCSVELKDCHVRAASRREGTDSAAPVAQNEFCLSSAIANQTQGQVDQDSLALILPSDQLFSENGDA